MIRYLTFLLILLGCQPENNPTKKRRNWVDDINFDSSIDNPEFNLCNTPPTGEAVQVDWNAVINMINDPNAREFPEGSPEREKADEFNQCYSYFLHLLHKTFNGEPEKMKKAVGMMYQLKYLAQDLLNIPLSE